MRHLVHTLSIALLACIYALPAHAELVKVKGKGEIVYSGGLFKPGQNSAEERAAILEAKKNALTRFAADFDGARFELYKKVEPQIYADIDQYVTDYTQLDQQVDKTSKRYTVIIEASVNSTMIENALKKDSAAAATGGANKAEASNMTFVFVARELASRKDYDAKRTTIDVKETGESASQSANVSEDGGSTTVGQDKTSITKNTTGGSVETMAQALTYRVTTVTEVDNAVNSVLTKANYEVVDPNDADLNVEDFKNDFSSGSDISAATRKAAIATCKEKEIAYICIANMDVGLPEKDDVTGLTRVYVTVTAKISYLPAKFPKTVASIAGKPYAGLGSNAQVAKQNALNEAAARSAQELVDQMRMKGVK